MNTFKKWIKSNWITGIFVVLFIILLVSPDAKTWFMRQIASTGLLNSTISESKIKDEITAHENLPAGLIVRNSDGSITDTSELKGKVVFINFWASWCPPCQAEFPSIMKFYEKYKDNPDIVILTVNLDDNPDLGKQYLEMEKYKLPLFTVIGEIPAEFFSGSLPTTIMLDKKGEIRFRHEGMADYSKKSFYEQVDALLKS